MTRPETEMYLLPPPRLVAPAELPPHLGGLRLAPYTGELPEEIEPFDPDPLEDSFTPELADVIIERALANDAVHKRLAEIRWQRIGASRIGERAKGETVQYLVVVYDYGSNLAVEITIDAESGRVVDISESRSQPVIVAAEIDRAVELARADSRLRDIDLTQLESMTIQVAPEELPEAGQNHRIVEVLFGCRGDRLPRHRAWVDLSTEQVLRAGAPGHCCDEGERR
jgi:hypothetical protein